MLGAACWRFVEFFIHLLIATICSLSVCPWQWLRNRGDVLRHDIALEWQADARDAAQHDAMAVDVSGSVDVIHSLDVVDATASDFQICSEDASDDYEGEADETYDEYDSGHDVCYIFGSLNFVCLRRQKSAGRGWSVGCKHGEGTCLNGVGHEHTFHGMRHV